MKPILLILSCTFSFGCIAQTGVFTDERDGQQYKTIVIAGKKWFRENLRFQTNFSFCPNFNKDSAACKDGNFYSNSELNTICPSGWHVATIPEWESYMSVFMKNNGINNGVLQYDTSKFLDKHFGISMKGAEIFKDTLLNLLPLGWVEGIRLVKNDGLTLWVVDTETNDEKYHFHIGKLGMVKHSHEHHIIDKPKKIRKFAVRCVCEITGPPQTPPQAGL
ncbi:MAG: hypothetical protein HOP10_12725 [Chitinophagaceae bacterium]|nr:hypothetical protein [Chitinophagaceae bacterium]